MSNIISSVDKLLVHIGTILRYIAPGFVTLLVMSVLNLSPSALTLASGSMPSPLSILTAVLTGIAIYAVHTGVVLRVLWFPIVWLHKKTKVRQVWKAMFDLDTERWLRRASEDLEVVVIQKEIDKWSAMLNFMYCSSYPMILLPIYRICAHGIAVGLLSTIVLVGGVVLLLSALISDYRITRREIWAMEQYPKGKRQPNN